MVRVCVREAHRREDVFPDPAAFDPSRFARKSYPKTEYSPFSDGPHACFGAALAYSLARIFLHELAAGFDARIVSDGPAVRGNNHWVHWRPNKSLRVALTARAG
jgi:cytochrome P450